MIRMKNDKIERYHFEEIVLILLILASDLSNYVGDDLESFSESIEGRIEVLFTRDFLSSFNKDYGINDKMTFELEELKNQVIKLYESQWIKKMIGSNQEISLIRLKASKILNELKIKNNDPKKFSEEHLNINW